MKIDYIRILQSEDRVKLTDIGMSLFGVSLFAY